MTRYGTFVEDEIVYVETDGEQLEIGDVDRILDVVGGHSWTIRYTDEEKHRHPEMDTSDEGLTVDVVDMMHAMTHSERFVDTLAAHPAELPDGVDPEDEDAIPPRMGLFVGKLLENLESGVS